MIRSLATAVLLLVLCAGTASAEVEEAEAYASLRDMTRGADAVVLGQVVATEPGRVAEGCGYTAATLRVDAVLAGSLPPADRVSLTLEYFAGCGTLPELGKEIPAERAVFFLRNGGQAVRMFQPDATEAQIQAAAPYWRPVISAGTVVDRAGTASVPVTLNAPFLVPWDGADFDAFVARVTELGRAVPDTATEPPAAASMPARIPAGPALVPLTAALGGLLFGRRLDRRRGPA